MEDADLVKLIQQGDQYALDLLIERHYTCIERFCYWKTGSRETALDLTQETFYRFFRSIGRYKHQDKCRAYLYTIARNLCHDHFRNHPQVPLPMDLYEDSYTNQGVPMEEQVNNRLVLYQTLRRLPQEQQELLVFRYGYDLSIKEIAAVTGVPVWKAYQKVNGALRTLKNLWKEEEGSHEQTVPRGEAQAVAAAARSPTS